jgi:sulfate/thiosulfate transport system ATP-binding protein
MSIEVQRLTKHFGRHRVLDDVSLAVEEGELLALLGPSGSGKTTLLRVVAGLESPDEGTVLLDGCDVTNTHVRHRNVGFVFQHYALFRHLTVFENVAFGLRVLSRRSRPSRGEIRDRVRHLLELVRLSAHAERYPHQLSGGQRQRVALVRALATDPKVLLLDEPFGALDAKVRGDLRRWLRTLHDQVHVTTILVTHDQDEAVEVADRIAVMQEGTIHQIGTPLELHRHPVTPFVADFLADTRWFEGTVHEGQLRVPEVHLPAAGIEEGTRLVLAVRGGDLSKHVAPGAPAAAVRVSARQPAHESRAKVVPFSRSSHG